jgi:hypothetical protein
MTFRNFREHSRHFLDMLFFNHSELRQKFYRYSYEKNLAVYLLMWLLVVIFFGVLIYTLVPSGGIKSGIILFLFAIWIISAVLWFFSPAWLNPNFRYLAWWGSQGLGRITEWLGSGWRPALFLVLGVALALFGRGIIIKNSAGNITINSTNYSMIINNVLYNITDATKPGFWTGTLAIQWIDLLSADFWMKVFLIAAILSIGFWAYRSKNRIILLPFTNQTHMSTLLMQEG